jgi:hypothetical protein
VAAGGIDVVLSAMRRHVDCTILQERGCGVLRSLAGTGSRAVKAAIGAAGGIDVVVGAMRRHSISASVLEHACGALCSLADLHAANVAAAVAAGAIGAVTAAMAAHDGCAALQLRCCDALRILAASENPDSSDALANKAAIAAAGGVALVVSAMRRHAEEMSLAYYWSDEQWLYEPLGDGTLAYIVSVEAVSRCRRRDCRRRSAYRTMCCALCPLSAAVFRPVASVRLAASV